MTPKDKQDIETIKTMLIFCVNSINEHENKPVMKIEDFQPDLEEKPDICNEEASEKSEPIFKRVKKTLGKEAFLAASKDERKEVAEYVRKQIDELWSHEKED